jgi:hypothetical protein
MKPGDKEKKKREGRKDLDSSASINGLGIDAHWMPAQ